MAGQGLGRAQSDRFHISRASVPSGFLSKPPPFVKSKILPPCPSPSLPVAGSLAHACEVHNFRTKFGSGLRRSREHQDHKQGQQTHVFMIFPEDTGISASRLWS